MIITLIISRIPVCEEEEENEAEDEETYQDISVAGHDNLMHFSHINGNWFKEGGPLTSDWS